MSLGRKAPCYSQKTPPFVEVLAVFQSGGIVGGSIDKLTATHRDIVQSMTAAVGCCAPAVCARWGSAFALCVPNTSVAKTPPVHCVPSWRRQRLCRVCSHCLRGKDTAFALCVPTVFGAETPPLPYGVPTAFTAKTAPLPCVSPWPPWRRQRLCPVFPACPVGRRLCPVCSHCLRDEDTACELCASTATTAKTAPLQG